MTPSLSDEKPQLKSDSSLSPSAVFIALSQLLTLKDIIALGSGDRLLPRKVHCLCFSKISSSFYGFSSFKWLFVWCMCVCVSLRVHVCVQYTCMCVYTCEDRCQTSDVLFTHATSCYLRQGLFLTWLERQSAHPGSLYVHLPTTGIVDMHYYAQF